MKHIILCADDYGQNAAISQAIIELIKKNRLSATSCMTNSYYWLSQAKWLEPYKDRVDIGLHINFTEGKPLTKKFGNNFLSLSTLITKAYLKNLDQKAIEDEIHAQIDQFFSGIGKLPDFIDGHQHIQQLPVIRDAILNVYESRLRQSHCYVRSVNNPATLLCFGASGYLKTLIIQLCGSFAFKKTLIKHHIPHNTSFEGFYDFASARNYPNLFPQFIEHSVDKGIIMCHPGLVAEGQDSIGMSRYFEYQYFLSDQFEATCKASHVQWTRFRYDG